MNLHSSRTYYRLGNEIGSFETPMNLHSSQTLSRRHVPGDRFETPMNLHSSQTYHLTRKVLYLFETPMNLHSSQTRQETGWRSAGLRPLWIYTALKRSVKLSKGIRRLRPLWIYTALKPRPLGIRSTMLFETPMNLHSSQTQQLAFSLWSDVWDPYEFTQLSNGDRLQRTFERFETPMNLHSSQTKNGQNSLTIMFETPMNLHSSQTRVRLIRGVISLRPLWIYTALKLTCGAYPPNAGLRPLWIYTALKQ